VNRSAWIAAAEEGSEHAKAFHDLHRFAGNPAGRIFRDGRAASVLDVFSQF